MLAPTDHVKQRRLRRQKNRDFSFSARKNINFIASYNTIQCLYIIEVPCGASANVVRQLGRRCEAVADEIHCGRKVILLQGRTRQKMTQRKERQQAIIKHGCTCKTVWLIYFRINSRLTCVSSIASILFHDLARAVFKAHTV